MLHLLPALLLLMLHGPSAMERGTLAERLPEAIRILCETAKSDEDDGSGNSFESPNPLSELLASAANSFEVTRLVAAWLSLASKPEGPALLDREPEEPLLSAPRNADSGQVARGVLRAHPNRAGPATAA